MPRILLTGLDGSNLLGFLAGIGCLRTLAEGGRSESRLGWEAKGGRWLGVLKDSGFENESELVPFLDVALKAKDRSWITERQWINLPKTGSEYAEALRELRQAGSADAVQMATALGTAAPEQEEPVDDTAFRTMSGAGHQHFLGFFAGLQEKTEASHLHEALFGPWTYTDDGFALRWDPADYRPHALRALDPSKDAGTSVRGANRLAVEALGCFPVFPGERWSYTVGFERRRKGEANLCWPLWGGGLTIEEVRSLLLQAHRLRQRLKQPRLLRAERELVALGVSSLWSCERFTEGKFRNFSASRPEWQASDAT